MSCGRVFLRKSTGRGRDRTGRLICFLLKFGGLAICALLLQQSACG